MRHYKKGRKLGTDASHTKAIKKNLCVALFTNDRIKTTLERAKEIRGDVDRVITWAKRGDVHSRRLAIAKLGDKNLVAELFAKVEQGLFEGRNGGYTRILKIGSRRGDAATIVVMELVQEPVRKKASGTDEKPKETKKASAKPKKDDEAVVAEESVEETVEAVEAEEETVEEVVEEVVEETTDDAAEEAEAEETVEAEELAEDAVEAEEAEELEAAPAEEETEELPAAEETAEAVVEAVEEEADSKE